MNFLSDFVTTNASGKNITVVTVAQGISLALNRANASKRNGILSIGKTSEATESFLASLFNKVQEGKLPSQGDVAAFLLGKQIV